MNLAKVRAIRLIFATLLVSLLSVLNAQANFLLPGYEFVTIGPSLSPALDFRPSGPDRGDGFQKSSSSNSPGGWETPSWGFGAELESQSSGPGGLSATSPTVSSAPAGPWDAFSVRRTFSFGAPIGGLAPGVNAWQGGAHWNRGIDQDLPVHSLWQPDPGRSAMAVADTSLITARYQSPWLEPGSAAGSGVGRFSINGKGARWSDVRTEDQPLSFGGRIYQRTSDPDHPGGHVYRWDDGDSRWPDIPGRPEHVVVCHPTRGDDEWWHRRAPDECPEFHIPDRDCDHRDGHHRRCHHPHCGGHHCRYPPWCGGDHCHTVPVPSTLMLSVAGLGCFGLVRMVRGRFRRSPAH